MFSSASVVADDFENRSKMIILNFCHNLFNCINNSYISTLYYSYESAAKRFLKLMAKTITLHNGICGIGLILVLSGYSDTTNWGMWNILVRLSGGAH